MTYICVRRFSQRSTPPKKHIFSDCGSTLSAFRQTHLVAWVELQGGLQALVLDSLQGCT